MARATSLIAAIVLASGLGSSEASSFPHYIGSGACLDVNGKEYRAWVADSVFNWASCLTICSDWDTQTSGNSILAIHYWATPNAECRCLVEDVAGSGSLNSPAVSRTIDTVNTVGSGAPASVSGTGLCYSKTTAPPTPSPCSAKVLVVIDTTYVKAPDENLESAVTAAKGIINELPFSSVTVSVGVARKMRFETLIDFDDSDATDQTAIISAIDGIDQANKIARTRFGSAMQVYADELTVGSTPGVMLLFSDGKVLKSGDKKRLRKIKEDVVAAHGNDRPGVICFKTNGGGRRMPRFFEDVCDEIIYSGINGVTDAQLYSDVADAICQTD